MIGDATAVLLLAEFEKADERLRKAEDALKQAQTRLAVKQRQREAARSRLYTHNGLAKP